jgi:uncharacterized delta-60 repeat protein
VKNGRAEKEKKMNANYKSIILAISLFFALSTSISAAPGDLDPTFGNGGIVITRGPNFNALDTAAGMAIQPDGKIVVVGDGTLGVTTWDFAVVRYNPDGSLDTSFGGTGIVHTPVGNSHDQATSVAIQADGKIVVAGVICNGVGNCSGLGTSIAVVRYNPNGSLDISFNGTGIVVTSVGGSRDGAFSLAIQTDGKIVVAGTSFHNPNSDIAIVRYNPNGSLDTTFGGIGKIIIPNGNNGGNNPSMQIQADGKVVVVGSSYNGSEYDFRLFRYQTDGSPDTSFNGTGNVISSAVAATGLAIQPDGKMVVVGSSSDSNVGSGFAVVRYHSNGSLDTSFGGTGKISVPIDGSAASVGIQADGKIVVVCNGNNPVTGFAVFRLNPNGSLDTTFNGTGKVTTRLQGYVIALAIQADGKIVVAGGTDDQLYDFYDFVVVRYQGDGATPTTACPNPIDCVEFFVRQHYLDFLNREPDAAGLAFWTDQINSCGGDPQCVEVKRINVSAAYFLSIEFQQTGYLVYRLYKAAYGNLPGAPVPLRLSEFLPDTQKIGQGVIVNQAGWEQVLENNKQAFSAEFVQRSRFTSIYPTSLTPDQFVDWLFINAGVTPSATDRTAAINEFGGTLDTSDAAARARALRRVAENSTLAQQEFNRAFVLMQYFGYLRRNPNDAPEAGLNFAGYDFWLNKLNSFNGDFAQAEMVKAFINSAEYRQRFGP